MSYEKVNWSSTKPINVDNLKKMDEGIANVENAMKKNIIRFEDKTNKVITTISTWTDMLSAPIEIDVKPSKYMCIVSFHLGTTGNGVATMRTTIDGQEIGSTYRCSVPTALGLTVSDQAVFPIEITGICNIMPQIWSTVECSVTALRIDLYEIGEIDNENEEQPE